MSAHTPGPWVVVDRKHWSASIALVTTGKPTPVAWASRLIKSGDDEALANARLIAAAPDLLEALRRVRHVLNSARHAESLIQQVDDALAKAEGI